MRVVSIYDDDAVCADALYHFVTENDAVLAMYREWCRWLGDSNIIDFVDNQCWLQFKDYASKYYNLDVNREFV